MIPRRPAGYRTALLPLEDRRMLAVIGYYDMALQAGDPVQEVAILAAGHTPRLVFDLTAAELAGLDVLDVQNPDNSFYGFEYPTRLAEIEEAVAGGMSLVIHDRYVDDAEAILPGGAGFNIVRDFSDAANIDVLDDSTLVTHGPGGTVDNATLDFGSSSSHGFAFADSLPDTAQLILSTGDPTHVVTFAYPFGAGTVVYSSIPLDYYRHGNFPLEIGSIYAPNVLAYAAENPLGGFSVRGSSPANGAIVESPPALYVLNVSEPLDPGSLDSDDLLVNGHAASQFAYVEGATSVTFTFDENPVEAEGLQVIQVADGAFVSHADGTPVRDYDASFRYDAIRLAVTSTSPANGGGAALPLATIDVQLNEAVDPSSVSASDLVLSNGAVTGVDVLDADSLRFHLEVPRVEGPLGLQIAAGALTDLFGNPGLSFEGTLQLDLGTVPFAGEFAAWAPDGSLAYAASEHGIIGVDGDVDRFVLELDAGQRIAVFASSVAGWQPRVILRAENELALAEGGGGPTGSLLLPAVTIDAAGDYYVDVSAPAGATGDFTIQVELNVDHELEEFAGGTNNSLATAQPLEPSFTSPDGVAERAFVRARAAAPGAAAQESEPNGTNALATVLNQNFTTPARDYYQLSIDAEQARFLDVDWFRLGELQAGDLITVAVAGAESARGTLFGVYVELYARVGDVETLMAYDFGNGPGSEGLIDRFPISATAEYFLRVDDYSNTGSYDLSVLLDSAGAAPQVDGTVLTESEPNELLASATDISDSWRRVVRESTTRGANSDFGDIDVYRVNLTAGDLLTVVVEPSPGTYPTFELLATRGGLLAADYNEDFGGRVGTYAFRAPATMAYYIHVNPNWQPGAYTLSLDLSSTAPPAANVAEPDFYSVELAAGESLSLALQTLTPELIQFELWNSAGGVIARGESGGNNFDQWMNDFHAPAAGTYYVMINARTAPEYHLLATRNATIGVENGEQLDRATFLRSASLDGAQRALGRITHEFDVDLYAIALGPNESLTAATATPGDGPGAPPNLLNARLRLLDSNGDVVAENESAAVDPRNARVTFDSQGGGLYYIEVVAGSDGGDVFGEYLLTVETPTPQLAPFAVRSVTPADGERLRFAPAYVDVEFNAALRLDTVEPGDLLLDGVPAASAEILDGATVRFFIANALAPGEHEVVLVAGGLESVQAALSQAFSSEFVLDTEAPRIVSSSLAPGGYLPTSAVNVSVTFAERMRADQLSQDDVELFSLRTQSYHSPVEMVWDASGTTLSLTYPELQEGGYRLTLFSRDGALEDLVGINMDGEPTNAPWPPGESGDGVEGGDFVVEFVVDATTRAFPSPLTSVGTLGNQAYRGDATGNLGFDADTDDFEIALDAGQTLTLIASGVGLTPTVTLLDSQGGALASATAAEVGGAAVLNTAAIIDQGLYRIRLRDAAGGLGDYSIRALLNAAVELEEFGQNPNDDRPHAQDTAAAFRVVGGASLASIAGRFNPPAGYLSEEMEPNNDLSTANDASATFVGVDQLYQLTIHGDVAGIRSGADWFNIGSLNAGDVLTINVAGQGSARGTLPVAQVELYAGPAETPILIAADYSSSGPGGDALIYRHTVTGVGRFTPIHIRIIGDGFNNGTYELTAWLENTGPAPITDGDDATETEPNNVITAANQVGRSWRRVGYQATTAGLSQGDVDTFSYDFQAGDVVTTLVTSQQFVDTNLVWRNADGTVLTVDDGSGGVSFDLSTAYGLRIPSSGRYYLQVGGFNTGQYTANVYLQSPVAPPTPVATSDYYRVHLSNGESLTTALQAQFGEAAHFSLENALGVELANSTIAAENFGAVLPWFVAPATGDYYLRIDSQSGGAYTLTFAKQASLDLESNDAQEHAQSLRANDTVFGSLSASLPTRLFATPTDGRNVIVELDPATGLELRQFPVPDGVIQGPDGLAFNGASLFYINGFGSGQLVEMNPDTGQVLDVDFVAFGAFDSLASLGDKVYIGDYGSDVIYEFDPATDLMTRQISVAGWDLIGGLAGAASINRLVATAGFGQTVLLIDPVDGTITPAFNAPGDYAGVAVIGEEIVLAALGGFTTRLDVYTFNGTLVRTVPLPYYVSALGGDAALPLDEDWFRVELAPGATLSAKTETPGFAPGEFVNLVDPGIELYGADGQLIIADADGAGDHHNAALRFTNPAGGTYFLRVVAAAGRGEYVLKVEQLAPSLPGDTDGDGDIDITDLNNVRNNFGGVGLGDTYPFDGDVDIEDLNAVRNNLRPEDEEPLRANPRRAAQPPRAAVMDSVFEGASQYRDDHRTNELDALFALLASERPFLKRR